MSEAETTNGDSANSAILNVRPSQFDAYKRYWDQRSAVEGQFYELYCYNKLIVDNPEIQMVMANIQTNKKPNPGSSAFWYSPKMKILSGAFGYHIEEFDALGIQDDTIYWCEITKCKELNHQTIKIKRTLLEKYFKDFTVSFSLITPRFREPCRYQQYVVPEPDYTPYFNLEYFTFDESILNCISLDEFNKYAVNYDYFDNLIEISRQFFDGDIAVLNKYSYLAYFYDIDKMIYTRFCYYNVQHNSLGYIDIINGSILMDGVRLRERSRARKEIAAILDRLGLNHLIT